MRALIGVIAAGFIATVAAAGAFASPPDEVQAVVVGAYGKALQPFQWVKPVASGKTHICDDYYPTHVAPTEGSTKLMLEITPQGDVVKAFVHQSSGNEHLDRAAVGCVSSWKFQPTLSNGVAVRLRAILWIAWSAAMAAPEQKDAADKHPNCVPWRPKGKPHICTEFPPADFAKQGIQGVTSIAFTVAADGTTKGIRVTRSSGNAVLDTAAISCATGWLYEPAIEEGKPIDAPGKADVNFLLH